MKKNISFLLLGMAVFASALCGFAQDDDAGPMITDPSKQPTVVESEQKVEVDIQALENIDLTKTPWLVESARIPASHQAFQRPKTLWAKSWLQRDVPEIEVERWVNDAPTDLAGKFIFVEVWATWCPPCRRSLSLLNFLHEKYADDLVVISICETDEEALKQMNDPLKLEDIKFHLAVDTGRRFADKLEVFGIPHAVLLEPVYGAVLWEGMPTQPGHELSDKKIEHFLAFREKLNQRGLLPKESPVKIIISEPEKKVSAPEPDQKN